MYTVTTIIILNSKYSQKNNDRLFYIVSMDFLSNNIKIKALILYNGYIYAITYIIRFTSLCKIFIACIFSRSFSVPCAPFSMLGGPGGTGCDDFAQGVN